MRLFRQEEDESLSSINITPLTDCMLVLLIIFMVTGAAISRTGFGITLPDAEFKAGQERSEITISITKEGSYMINGEKTAQQNLVSALSERNAGDKAPVIIDADSRCSYAKVMAAIDAAKRAGFEEVSLSAETD